MPPKAKLFALVMLTIVVVALVVVKSNKPPAYRKGSSALFDTAIGGALNLYKQRAREGMDMSRGPCLTNDLMNGWVVDVVHSPRETVDDLPENQCQAYLEGRAKHFVELDTGGNLVRVR